MDRTVEQLITGIRAGDRRALARSITLVENANPASFGPKTQLLDALAQLAGNTGDTVRVGISGTPGVGKSTLIEAIGMKLIERGHRVAVLAVDPTSRRTGGSILGDKTRMPQLAVHPDAFVRPSPAGGGLGGITGSTAAAVSVCEAAGFDIVIVETVGVGQSETAVDDVTDLFLLLHSPGGGDELQGIKRGVMELADWVAVTKADGDLLPAARRAALELRSALHLMRPKTGRGMTPVSLCSAVDGEGLDELMDGILEQHAALHASGELSELRQEQKALQFQQAVDEGTARNRTSDVELRTVRSRVVEQMFANALSPAGAAQELVSAMDQGLSSGTTELNAMTLFVGDMARSVRFYEALGLPVVFGGTDATFTTLQHGANFVNLQLQADGPDIVHWGRPIFFVEDPDAVHAAMLEAGYQPQAEPVDAPWGERYFHIVDPDGHEISFARRL